MEFCIERRSVCNENGYSPPGWITLFLAVVLFKDVVGVIRVRVYNERTIYAEIVKRKLIIKALLTIAFAYVFYLLK